MVQGTEKQPSVLGSLDWWTVGIYLALLTFGWLSVCGASYTYGDTDIFSLDTRSGMQILWIGTSICLGFVLIMLDDRFYDTFAYIVYGLFCILLFFTIFNPHEIKGSRSWIVLGPLRFQPAEFAKFATALAVAKLMSTMLLIVGQKETGSALVYLSFFLVFYRDGMPGSILFTGVALVFYFVVGIKYEHNWLWDTPTSVGKFIVLLSIQIFSAAMVYVYCKDKKRSRLILYYSFAFPSTSFGCNLPCVQVLSVT